MNWTQHELNLIDRQQDLIERRDLVGLLRAFSKEDEIGEGTNNAGLKIVFGILMVDPKIPFYLEVDWGLSYMKDGAKGFKIIMTVNPNKSRYRVKFLFSRKFMPEIYSSLSRPYEHQSESIIKQDLVYELRSILSNHISKEHIEELIKQVPFSIRWS